MRYAIWSHGYRIDVEHVVTGGYRAYGFSRDRHGQLRRSIWHCKLRRWRVSHNGEQLFSFNRRYKADKYARRVGLKLLKEGLRRAATVIDKPDDRWRRAAQTYKTATC